MKRFLALSILALLSCAPAFSWGKLGHATVARIAEDHLNPRAHKRLAEYLGGKSLDAIASDADKYRSVWTMDLGFIPKNPDDARVKWLKKFDFSTPLNISPWSHSITVDENFKCYPTDNLDGSYINNDAYYVDSLARVLKKNHKTMDPDERYRDIALIVHFLGDMHCPMHIVYYPANTVKGHINVYLNGKKKSLHAIWDGVILSDSPQTPREMADLIDNASRREIRSVTRGTVYDWAGRAAEACWPLHCEYKSGDKLPNDYVATHHAILYKELREGGYRLASVLNYIFR